MARFCSQFGNRELETVSTDLEECSVALTSGIVLCVDTVGLDAEMTRDSVKEYILQTVLAQSPSRG